MEIVTQVLNNIDWSVVGLALGGAGLVSLVLQNVKRWLSLQSHRVIMFLNLGFCFVLAAVHYVATVPTQDPRIIAAQALLLTGLNQPIYHTIIKPIGNLLSDAKAERERRDTEQSVVQDGEIPLEDVPVQSQTEDFGG